MLNSLPNTSEASFSYIRPVDQSASCVVGHLSRELWVQSPHSVTGRLISGADIIGQNKGLSSSDCRLQDRYSKAIWSVGRSVGHVVESFDVGTTVSRASCSVMTHTFC